MANKKLFFTAILIFAFSLTTRFLPIDFNHFYFQTDSTFYLRTLQNLKKNGSISFKDNLFVKKEKRDSAKIAPPLLIYSAYLFEKLLPLNNIEEKKKIAILNILWGALLTTIFFLLLFFLNGNFLYSVLFTLFFSLFPPFFIRSSHLFFRGEIPSVVFLLAILFLLKKIQVSEKIATRDKIFFLISFVVGMGFWRLFPLLTFPLLLGITIESTYFKTISHKKVHTLFLLIFVGINVSLFFKYYKLNFFHILFLNLLLISIFFHYTISEKIKNKSLLKFILYIPAISLLFLIAIRFYRYFFTGGINNFLEIYERGVKELLPLKGFYLLISIFIFILIFLHAFMEKNLREEIKKLQIHTYLVPTFFFFFSGVAFKRTIPYFILFASIVASILLPKLKHKKIKIFMTSLYLTFTVLFFLQSISTINRKMDLNRILAYEYIKKNIPPKTPIIAMWGLGYELEYYTNHPVIADGFLEDKTTQRRILNYYTILNSKKELELVALLKKYKTKYIFVNKEDIVHILSTKYKIRELISTEKLKNKRRIIIKKKGRKINVIKLYFLNRELKYFRPLFSIGNYGIFILKRNF